MGIDARTAAISVLLSETWAMEKMIRAVRAILPASNAHPMLSARNPTFRQFTPGIDIDTNTYATPPIGGHGRLQEGRRLQGRGEIKIDDPGQPLSLLDSWISEAKERGLVEPNAMSISTVSPSGSPRSRMVLLKMVEGDEIGFFTNLESDKSLEIAGCDSVAVTMWWPEMERQVRMEGTAYQMERSQVEEYHHSRSRKSRIGAWASAQSREMDSKDDLRSRFEEFESKFEGSRSPCLLTGGIQNHGQPGGVLVGKAKQAPREDSSGEEAKWSRSDSTPDRGF